MHDYVIYCYRLPAGSGSMFAMGISVPQFIGAIGLLNYDDEASLRQSLGVWALPLLSKTNSSPALPPAERCLSCPA